MGRNSRKRSQIRKCMQGIATAKIGSACIANELHTENPRTVRSNRSCGDEFAKSLKWQAEHRRRTTAATTGNGIDGFMIRLVDLLFHLYENIPPGCTSTGAANLCIGCLSLTDLALVRHLNTTVLSTRVCQRSPTLRAKIKCVMGRTSRGRSRSCWRNGLFTRGRC